jgi:hypothetical protein
MLCALVWRVWYLICQNRVVAFTLYMIRDYTLYYIENARQGNSREIR